MLDGKEQKKIILSKGEWRRFFPLLSKLKVTVFKIFLLLFGTIFSLIILEISAIIFLKFPSAPAPFRFSPLLQFEHVPNYSYKNVRPEFNVKVHYNSSGFRDKEYPLDKNKAVRIAIVGDSYVEGAEVALGETFVKRLERLLND